MIVSAGTKNPARLAGIQSVFAKYFGVEAGIFKIGGTYFDHQQGAVADRRGRYRSGIPPDIRCRRPRLSACSRTGANWNSSRSALAASVRSGTRVGSSTT